MAYVSLENDDFAYSCYLPHMHCVPLPFVYPGKKENEHRKRASN
jgi:hypothetical protein